LPRVSRPPIATRATRHRTSIAAVRDYLTIRAGRRPRRSPPPHCPCSTRRGQAARFAALHHAQRRAGGLAPGIVFVGEARADEDARRAVRGHAGELLTRHAAMDEKNIQASSHAETCTSPTCSSAARQRATTLPHEIGLLPSAPARGAPAAHHLLLGVRCGLLLQLKACPEHAQQDLCWRGAKLIVT
jgi:hypothetical protein